MRKLHQGSTNTVRNTLSSMILSFFGIVFSFHSLNAQCDVYSGSIQGTIFQDLDFNGLKSGNDNGLSNVLIKAFSANGDLADQAMSDYFGNYTLEQLTDNKKYRLEFSYTSDFKVSQSGLGNNTDIQFATSPSCNNNFGLVNASSLCLDNSKIALTCFVKSVESENDGVETIVYTDYNFTSNSQVKKYAIKSGTGSVWGLTWKSSTKDLFSSAFVKQYAALTSHGHDAIFKTNTISGETSLFAKLSDLGLSTGVVAGNHNDPAYGAQVGKIGLGGIEISDDEQFLYVVNIYNNTLVKLSSSEPKIFTTESFNIPNPGCKNQDTYKAFALTKNGGKFYVGVTCTSFESGAAGELSATVFEFDPITKVFTNIFSTDYPKGFWKDTPANSTAVQGWLTDLAFTDEGNMVLSLSDRVAHRYANLVTNGRLDDQHPDILLAYKENGVWTLESGGKAGQYTGSHPISADGPGNGEFFGFDFWVSGPNYHSEIATGSVVVLPGSGSVVATVFDPEFDSYTGGLHRYSTSNGSKLGSLVVYAHSNNPLFGKASGLGNVVQMCESIPLEIGNLLWIDSNKNGVQDPGEPFLPNVELSLYDEDCQLVGITQSNENGNYYFNESNVDVDNDGTFDGLNYSSNYYVVVSDSDFSVSTGRLTKGMSFGLTNDNTGFGTNLDSNDSDGSIFDGNCDELVGRPYILVKTGGSGTTDHSFDFGFSLVEEFDLALIKTTDETSVKAGSNIVFDITVINQGTMAADNIIIVDYIPNGLTLNDANWTNVGPDQAKFLISSANGTLPAEGLTSGNSVTIQVTMTLNPDFTAGTLINIAEIGGAEDTNGNDLTPYDTDSSPDDDSFNDIGGIPFTPSDNEVDDNGLIDEDDHDPAYVSVFESGIEEGCICLGNATYDEKGQFGQIIRVRANSGQTWYVHQTSNLYDPENLPSMGTPSSYSFYYGSQYPLTSFNTGINGFNLQEFPIDNSGLSDYYLTGISLDGEDFQVVLRNNIGDQTIIDGSACDYDGMKILGNSGVCANSTNPYCLDVYNQNLPMEWVILSGDAQITGSNTNECVNINFGNSVGTLVRLAYTMVYNNNINNGLAPLQCISPTIFDITIGENGGILSCLANINSSLNNECEIGLTPDAILTSPLNPNAAYGLVYTDIQGKMLPQNVDWHEYIGSTVIAKVMDQCSGNSCWSFIKVEDKRAPEIECFDLTISCIDMSEYNGPFTLDNCSGESELIQTGETKTALDCDPDYVYLITRSYKSIDGYGNISPECTQTIYVERPNLDNIVRPSNYTVANNNPLSCAGYVTNEEGQIDPLVYGVPTLDGYPLYPNNDQFCNLGVAFQDVVLPTNDCVQKIMRTWTVFEWWCEFGEMDTIVQVFNIADKEDPIIKCPQNIKVSSNSATCSGNVLLPAAVVSDDCTKNPLVDITFPGGFLDNMNGGNISLPLGIHEVVYTVYDDCFNSTSCSLQVTVTDNSPPIAVCKKNTVLGLKADGTTYAYASAFDNGSYDDCEFDRVEVRRMDGGSACNLDQNYFSDKVNFCCADVGNNVIVVLRAYDKAGNYNDCMINVEIQDKNPPTIEGPDDITVSCLTEFDFDDLSEFGIATSMDNCMNSTIQEYISININECRVGTITRTFIASDGNGTASTTQIIHVENEGRFDGEDIDWPDDYATSASCSAGSLEPQNLPAPYNYPIIIEDYCDQVAISHSDLVYNIVGSGGACQKIVRTWIIEDFCQPLGNNKFTKWEYDQTITISNSVAPVITSDCSDVTVCSLNENCSTGPITLSAGAQDDCTPGAMLNWSYSIDFDIDGIADISSKGKGDSITIQGEYPIGIHSVIFTFEDLCGNKVSCTQKFTIENCLGPSAVCLQGLSVGLEPMDTDGDNIVDNEMATVKARMFNASSSHPCGQEITYSFSENPLDSCITFNCNDIGINDVSIYVFDETGRFDFCVTTIDVQDNNLVDICTGVEECIEMPADITVTTCTDDLDPITINSMPTVDPDCICTQYELDYIDTDLSDPNNTCTIIRRDWLVTFTCGFPKTFETTQMITKYNDKAPIITCPDPVSVSTDGSACEALAALDIPIVSSDCSTGIVITNDSPFANSNSGAATGLYPVGQTSVIYTVTDQCNNSSSCEVIVNVVDGTSPICNAQDITISILDASIDVTVNANDIDNNSTDECGLIVTRTIEPSVFGCADAGTSSIVTLTVTDDSGNSSSCEANVTIVDGVAPTCLARNSNANILTPGNFTVPIFLLNNNSFDECGVISTITAEPNTFSCNDLGERLVVLTVTDNSGNSSTCTSIVTVRDIGVPNCVAQDITVQLDGSDQATITGADIDNGSTDLCSGIDTLTVTPNVFTCDNLGANNVVLTVTDNSGNTSTCSAIVTVESPNSLLCIAQDVTIYLDEAGSATITADEVNNGSGIPCADDVSISIDRTEFFCNDVDIPREVTLTVVGGGLSITCVSMVTVRDTLPPVVICPIDLTVNCQELSSDLTVYGEINTDNSNCLVLPADISETDVFNLNDCGIGNVIRTFVAIGINGNSSTCDQTITVINPDPFVLEDITWPSDTIRITECTSLHPDTLSSNPILRISSEACSNISVDFEDISLTNNQNCMDTISRTWTVIDSCQLMEGTSDGIFTFVQFISLIDEMAPIISAVDSISQCELEVVYSFLVEDCNDVTITNDSGFGTGNDISGTYPSGETKVKISAVDKCGNTSTDSIIITITPDTIPPSIICVNRSIIIEEDGVTEVTAGDGAWYFTASDNKTDSADLVYSFHSDFRADTLRFICDSVLVKSHTLKLYVKDAAGNVDSCIASYVAIDPNGVCTSGLAAIQGQINTEKDLNIPDVQVNLINGDIYEMTNTNGLYVFPEMKRDNVYELKPVKDTDHMAGVSTLDLVYIQRHLLGLATLNSAYQLIASDINNSGDISAKDILDLKKNILGIQTRFPNNTSWRFIDKDYKFIDANNPFNEILAESYMIYNMSGPVNKDFVGVKIGDVNGSIQMNKNTSSSTRSKFIALNIENKIVAGDSDFNIPVIIAENVNVSGMQISIVLDKDIIVKNIESDKFKIASSDFNISSIANKNILTLVIVPTKDIDLKAGDIIFQLEGHANATVQLSEELVINSDFENELYNNNLEIREIGIAYSDLAENSETDLLYQNAPNPWSDKTNISFKLGKDQKVTINVYSVNGKLVEQHNGAYKAGTHSVELKSSKFSESGIYYYELLTETNRISKRMILIK